MDARDVNPFPIKTTVQYVCRAAFTVVPQVQWSPRPLGLIESHGRPSGTPRVLLAALAGNVDVRVHFDGYSDNVGFGALGLRCGWSVVGERVSTISMNRRKLV